MQSISCKVEKNMGKTYPSNNLPSRILLSSVFRSEGDDQRVQVRESSIVTTIHGEHTFGRTIDANNQTYRKPRSLAVPSSILLSSLSPRSPRPTLPSSPVLPISPPPLSSLTSCTLDSSPSTLLFISCDSCPGVSCSARHPDNTVATKTTRCAPTMQAQTIVNPGSYI